MPKLREISALSRPFTLRVLGAADLSDAIGRPVEGVAAQPKILALLVYLALQEQPGFVRRDHLLGMFWGDLDQEHARAALRTSLHSLRQAVGPEEIRSRGDDEVAIAADGIKCDAVEFRSAVESGQAALAMELYRGTMLPGFFLRNAPEFDQWLELHREQMRRQASTSAWLLAQRAEGDMHPTNAADWARKAITLAPLDERLVRKAIALFARVGDRAAAMDIYERFHRRLRSEFGVDPTPETMALVRQVRGGS